ncbi:hypothetical protein AB0B66_10590 [Catellatospora sp. NPDC049111]|uniref:hypothetical protein n=1 Tax=Catellatospora sp. NPDC049111 TaxID=3155271 RepID=UPI0033FBBBEF
MTYADGDQLAEVFDHWFSADETTTAEDVAGWAYLAFSAPLEALADLRRQGRGESAFLAGSLYHLLGRRCLYIGDVVEVRIDQDAAWLACERKGWRRIEQPAVVDGAPLSAELIYEFRQSMPRN